MSLTLNFDMESKPAVEIVRISPGDGKTYPKRAQICTIHYHGILDPQTRRKGKDGKEGKLIDPKGRVIDSSVERGEPFDFILGAYSILMGIEESMYKVSLGEKVKLIIPPELAFGDSGIKHWIPPNSTVIYEVQLLNIKNDWY